MDGIILFTLVVMGLILAYTNHKKAAYKAARTLTPAAKGRIAQEAQAVAQAKVVPGMKHWRSYAPRTPDLCIYFAAWPRIFELGEGIGRDIDRQYFAELAANDAIGRTHGYDLKDRLRVETDGAVKTVEWNQQMVRLLEGIESHRIAVERTTDGLMYRAEMLGRTQAFITALRAQVHATAAAKGWTTQRVEQALQDALAFWRAKGGTKDPILMATDVNYELGRAA